MREKGHITIPSRLLARLACGLALGAAVAGAASGVAGGTTGPGYLIAPPKYRIPLKVIRSYSGRYVSTRAARASGIQSSEVYIGIAESGYAAGGISIYRYDAAGSLQTFAGTLYDFHLVGRQVQSDIVGPGGTPVLGHFDFAHAPGSKNLTGTIQPPGSSGRSAISYRFAASGGPLPGQANAPVPGPPNIGVVHGNSGTGTAAPPKSVSGWGPTGRFLGRYHLIPGRPVVPASQPAGIFTVALSDADRLSAAAQVPTSGQLSMFMRTVKKTLPPEPSGILSLQSGSGSEVVYLTKLTSAGLVRKAQVHGGSFLGPQIGTFSGTAAPGKLSGRLSASGIGTFAVSFNRFSTKPAP